MFGKVRNTEFGTAGLQETCNIGVAFKQGVHEIVLPYRRSGFARLSENGLFIGGVGIGIQHIDGERAACQQCLAQRFGVVSLGAYR